MKHMICSSTKIEYKTDGKNVWWFSKIKHEWISDERMTVPVFENIIATGNGYKKITPPRPTGRTEAIMTFNQIVWLGVVVICVAFWSVVGFYVAR